MKCADRLPARRFGRVFWAALALTVFSGDLTTRADAAAKGEEIVGYAPLLTAADLIQQRYGVVVTFEDPIRVWPGDLDLLGLTSQGKKIMRSRLHRFVTPTGLTRDETPRITISVLTDLVKAYGEQNPQQPRFAVIESPVGFHIVPIEAITKDGAVAKTGGLLDLVVEVRREKRTATEHVKAICDALTSLTGSTVTFTNLGFDHYFAANSYILPSVVTDKEKPFALFGWGSSGRTAREALIDLVDRSKTTMSWSIGCSPGVDVPERICYLNLKSLRVGPERRILRLDRCTDCKRVPKE